MCSLNRQHVATNKIDTMATRPPIFQNNVRSFYTTCSEFFFGPKEKELARGLLRAACQMA